MVIGLKPNMMKTTMTETEIAINDMIARACGAFAGVETVPVVVPERTVTVTVTELLEELYESAPIDFSDEHEYRTFVRSVARRALATLREGAR